MWHVDERELRDPHGEVMQRRAGQPSHREVQRLIGAGTEVLVWWGDDLSWVSDAASWWADHERQVETFDHPSEGPWPEREDYLPSVWFSSNSTYLVLEVAC